MSRLSIKLLLTAALASSLFLTVPSFADSQARVVRLSDVQGDVQIDRNVGQGFEKAFLNLPITQGVKVQVGKDGRAEVEFEDGSTLRVTPNTVRRWHLYWTDIPFKAAAVLRVLWPFPMPR